MEIRSLNNIFDVLLEIGGNSHVEIGGNSHAEIGGNSHAEI
jgi:hypothetical protein